LIEQAELNMVGASLCSPESGSTYRVNVAPGTSRMILIRKLVQVKGKFEGRSMSRLVKSNKQLEKEAVKNGRMS